jgi:hypothetical protein
MDIKIEGFTVTGLTSGAPVNINITIGGGGDIEGDTDASCNLSDDFQAPIDRAANISDTAEDITAEQNSRFIQQFAKKLTGDPIHGDVASEALSAVENMTGENKDGKKNKKG